MACLDDIHSGLCRHGNVGCGQHLHAGVAGVAGGLAHLLGGLDGGDDWAGDGYGQAALFELGLGLVAAGFAGFGRRFAGDFVVTAMVVAYDVNCYLIRSYLHNIHIGYRPILCMGT